ncbi:hypothetical protein [Paremcibacter congregatus]|uniref:hypothetical protein n=1 Tax=Paremcibacter congregatus TaxID=2043170 RepID=UPI0030EB2AB2|tara:strand:- start:3495 stop:4868 length:1374 start_codon:yes stop_codon:yes gene_type:complete
MNLTIPKHYAKRIINFSKNPFLRSKTLIFKTYEINFPSILMIYELNGVDHTIRLDWKDCKKESFDLLAKDQWDILVGNIGMIASAALLNLDKIKSIHCAFLNLSPSACHFFEDYISGEFAEYRFLNGINPKNHVEITGDDTLPLKKLPHRKMQNKVLVMNGGGKDSVVMSELIDKLGFEQAWFTNAINTVRKNVITRSVSQESYHLNFSVTQNCTPVYTKDCFVPMGAFSAALSLIPAYIHNIPYIAMGNEYSANEGNVVFNGFPINHQYNKSYEFEEKLCRHIKENITEEIHFFSFLRPLYELKIVKIFSSYKKYFTVFVSCNRYISRAEWCKECEKCAFIYLALFPFISREELTDIFGEDILLKPVIRKHILSITQDKIKPWECVGVKDECKMALALMLEKDKTLDFEEFPFRTDFEDACKDVCLSEANERFLNSFNEPHGIPAEWVTQYKELTQ